MIGKNVDKGTKCRAIQSNVLNLLITRQSKRQMIQNGQTGRCAKGGFPRNVLAMGEPEGKPCEAAHAVGDSNSQPQTAKPDQLIEDRIQFKFEFLKSVRVPGYRGKKANFMFRNGQ
eukprot:3792254-Rhodomonas_salina.1